MKRYKKKRINIPILLLTLLLMYFTYSIIVQELKMSKLEDKSDALLERINNTESETLIVKRNIDSLSQNEILKNEIRKKGMNLVTI